MAERVVDLAARNNAKVRHSETSRIPLAGVERFSSSIEAEASNAAAEFEVPLELVTHLISSYGGNFRAVLEIAGESAELRERLIEGLPHIAAEAVYAARYEMAATAADFLVRRTRISLLARDHGASIESRVTELMQR